MLSKESWKKLKPRMSRFTCQLTEFVLNSIVQRPKLSSVTTLMSLMVGKFSTRGPKLLRNSGKLLIVPALSSGMDLLVSLSSLTLQVEAKES